MPSIRAVITWYYVSMPVRSAVAFEAGDQFSFAVAYVLVVGPLWFAVANLRLRPGLSWWRIDFFILAFVTSFDTFEVISNLKRQTESFGIAVLVVTNNATKNADCLDRRCVLRSNTTRTKPLLFWRVARI